MPYEYTHTHRVTFAETDMAGIVHFSNFYRMMENAEHAFFRSLGFSIHTDFDGVPHGWPRVAAACEFFKPLRFEETVEIQLLIIEVRNRSVRYGFRFWKTVGGEKQEVARGTISAVCTTLDKATGRMTATAIPTELRAKLENAPAELIQPHFSSKNSVPQG